MLPGGAIPMKRKKPLLKRLLGRQDLNWVADYLLAIRRAEVFWAMSFFILGTVFRYS
jgi:hypothetical protein